MRAWSPSSVAQYETCPRAWWIQHRAPAEVKAATKRAKGSKPPMPIALGIAAHRGLEAAHKAAASPWALYSGHMTAFADVAIEAVREACIELGIDETPEADQVEDEVFAVLHSLHQPRPGTILGVELELRDEVDGVPFVNVLDLVLRTGPTSIHLRDWKRKSIKSLPLSADLGDDPQLCSNRHAVARHFPWATTVTVGLYSIISNREVGPRELPMSRAEHVMSGKLAVIDRAESDTEWRPTPDGVNCERCRSRPACPLWAHLYGAPA